MKINQSHKVQIKVNFINKKVHTQTHMLTQTQFLNSFSKTYLFFNFSGSLNL